MGTKSTRWMTQLLCAAMLAVAVPLAPAGAWAGTIWDAGGGNTNINTAANWDLDTLPTLTGGTSALTFGVPSTAGTTVNVNTNIDVLGITLNRNVGSSSIYNFLAGGGTVTVRASGITVASTSIDQINIAPNVIFNGSQSLTNNGSGLIAFSTAAGSITGTGSPTITNNGTGTGIIQISPTINNTVSKFIQNSATSDISFRSATNAFADLEIKKGTVRVGNGGTALGSNAGTLTLGNSGGGTDSATLMNDNNSNDSYAKPITLASGVTGTLTIAQNLDNTGVFTVTFTGGVTGSNSFTIENRGGNDNIAFTTNTLNNAGKITHIGTGGATGTATISSVVGTNVTGVVQNSATSTLVFTTSANTYSSGLTIKAGTVTGSVANSFGANANIITIGDSVNNADATLVGAGAVTYANPISVASGNSNVATISSTANATFSGPVTLNSHALTLAASGSTLALTGGITGTGNLTIATTGVGTTTVSTNAINNTGTITNSGTGAGLSTISGGVGSNVTAITENSSNSALTISTSALTVNSGGTTLTNSNAAGANLFTVSGGISGTGNLILKNNSGIANGVTISTNSVNNAGAITNSGTGIGSVLISSTIGTNVTQVIQNSASSRLILSGASSTGPGSVLISAGTLQIGASNVLPDAVPLSINGGVFDTSTFSDTVGAVTVAGTGTIVTGTGTLGLSAGLTTAGLTGPTTLTSNILFAGTQSIANNDSFLLSLTSVTTNFTGSGSPTITNSGTGTGGVTLQGTLPSSVSKIVQNSATSMLLLRSPTNGFGDLEIKKGTVQIGNGGTVMGTGTLTLGNSLGGSDSASLIQNNNATEAYAKNITLATGVTGTLTIGTVGDGSGTFTVTFSGSVTGNNSVTFENVSGDESIILSGLVNNAGVVTHTGAGTGILSLTNVTNSIGSNVTSVVQDSATSQLNLRGQSNAFAGSVVIKKGTVGIGSFSSNLGTGPVTIGDVAGGSNAASLVVVDNSSLSFANPIILAANTTGTLKIAVADDTGVNTHTLTGGVTGTNHLTIESQTGDDRLTFSTGSLNNTGTITHTGAGSGVVTVNSVIGPNVTGLTQNSATSTLTLTAANTFRGDTKVSAGTLKLSNNLALQNSALDTSGAGVVDVTGVTTPTLGGLKGSTNLAAVITTGYGSVTALTLNPGVGANPSYAGVIANGAAGMTLTKTGAGTQILTGVNTYSGATTVSQGTLVVGVGGVGSINNSAVTVLSGATLAGSGSSGAVTINAGATHKPGNSPGIYTVGGIYTENGDLNLEFFGTGAAGTPGGYSQVHVTATGAGSVALGGSSTLSINYTGGSGNFNPTFAQVFTLIDHDGNTSADTTGMFSNYNAEGSNVIIDGKTLKIFYHDGGSPDQNNVVLVATGTATGTLYVNNEWTSPATVNGDLETGSPAAFVGVNAFATPTDLLAAQPAFAGNVVLNGGTYASALLAGGGGVQLQLVNDTVNSQPDVTIAALSGDANDSIATRFHNVAGVGDLTVQSGSFAGQISGGGDLTKTTGATLILDGTNTYSGVTTISGGTLQIGSGSTTGTLGAGNVVDDAALVFNRSNTYAVANAISGSGTVDQVGSGTTLFSGANTNTYTGVTTVSNGTLELARTGGGNKSIAGDGVAATADLVISGGNVLISASEQIADNARVNLSSGSFMFNGTGLTETIGSFTNTGGVFSTNGANTLIGTGNTMTWAGGTNTITSGGIVQDNNWVISGGTNTVQGGPAGALQVQTGGTGLHFSGTATHGVTLNSDAASPGRILLQNDVFVDNAGLAGTAQILSGGSAAVPGTVDMDGGTRTFDVINGTAAVDMLISARLANGALTKTGAGTLRLTGDNTYTGATTVTTGTLQLVDPGVLQNGSVAVNGGAFQQTGGTNNVTGVGGGDLTITGAGAYSLTGGTLDFHDYSSGSPTTWTPSAGRASTISLPTAAQFSFTGGTLQDVSNINVTDSSTFTQNGGEFIVGQNGTGPAALTTIDGGFSLLAGIMRFDAFGADPTPEQCCDGLASLNDQITVTGDVLLNSVVNLDFVGYTPVFGDAFTLFCADNITLGPNFGLAGGFFRIIPTGDPNNPFALQAIVPEPASVAMWTIIGIAGAAGAYRSRRRSKGSRYRV